VHIAAGREIWFATTDVSVNDPSAPFEVSAGPVDAPDGTDARARAVKPGPVRLLLAKQADLTVNLDHWRVDVSQLRAMGVRVDGVVHRVEQLPPLPEVDREYFRARARQNTANADINRAAGEFSGDAELLRKTDSVYSPDEWAKVHAYFRTGRRPPRLTGVVYVRGGLSLMGGARLEIADGSLVTESSIHLGQGAVLEVLHSSATRTLPGVLVLDNGALVVMQGARLRAHGLVYTNRIFDVSEGARVDVVGSVAGGDRGLSFRNHAAQVVIRYDPAVLGTPGLRAPADGAIVTWIASWEDLP
jgi:hypothetical protein